MSHTHPGEEYTPETVGGNTQEMKQRKDITCELPLIENTAVGFLGIATVLFKEKQMGVIRVHADALSVSGNSGTDQHTDFETA